MKILNLYAGIGGNRALWKGHDVTAIESNPIIAKEYQKQFPKDKVVVADAHTYLEKNYKNFDFIWSSPPCVKNSRLILFSVKQYPDLRLYEEIIFLSYNSKVNFVIENTRPYYKPLIPPTIEMSGQFFWANFPISRIELCFPKSGNHFLERERVYHRLKWLGLNADRKNLKGVRFRQVVDNCIHPKIGLHILNQITK